MLNSARELAHYQWSFLGVIRDKVRLQRAFKVLRWDLEYSPYGRDYGKKLRSFTA